MFRGLVKFSLKIDQCKFTQAVMVHHAAWHSDRERVIYKNYMGRNTHQSSDIGEKRKKKCTGVSFLFWGNRMF